MVDSNFLSDLPQQVPILLDTDPGSDIDDAVAISYLLSQPRCELLGVTTVTGDVQKRAALVEMLCHTAGRNIPIHCGKRDALLDGPGQPGVPQYNAVSNLPHRLDRPENTAVEFLLETIRSRPNEIVLLTIGPLSNIGLLVEIDPSIPSKLRGIVSMAGRHFSEPFTEHNTNCDPLAAAITYRASGCQHVSFGLDVTMQVSQSKPEVESRFTPPFLRLVRSMAEEWFGRTDRIIFHDPLAAASIFHPGLCAYEQGQIQVDPNNGRHRFAPGNHPHFAASSVDVGAFFEEFYRVVG